MKVLIAAAAFSSGMSGIQRHAFNLVRCLLQQSAVSAVHLVIAPWQRELVQLESFYSDPRFMMQVDEMGRGSMGRNTWYYSRLPQLVRSLEADIVHLSYPVPVNKAAYACPTVVTLHDLYPYEIPLNFGFPKFIFNRVVLRQCLRNIDAIACVSDATNMRLRQYAPPETWGKSLRIYNCVEPQRPAHSDDGAPVGRGAPFLLCVAQHRRNKNIPLLIRSFDYLLRYERLPRKMNLFIVGMSGPETPRIHKLIAELRLSHRILFLEGLSDAQLHWCYAHCAALVAPSSTEGFGLPVAEGLLEGCHVVCSDIQAFREVGSGHCLFVSLHGESEQALANAIVAVLARPAPPPISLPQLSAQVLAEQYLALYRQLLTSVPFKRGAAVAGPLQTTSGRRAH
jgi:glycosyltransferase involved in cell wall biosynthesis